MKLFGFVAGKCIQLLLITSMIAVSLFAKYDRSSLFANETNTMQISNWEGLSFELDEDYLIEFYNTFTPILLPNKSEKKSFPPISLAYHFQEIVIPPPNA
ncbi:MAG: hypothetical protein EBX50_00625 [Chitinophagia bacterium]|nr:hypothetical protein [Chitinophagia bacterium]